MPHRTHRHHLIRTLFLSVVLIVSVGASAAHADEQSPAEQVADVLKDSVSELSPAQVQGLLQQHYMRLRLIDGEGAWASPALEAIGDFLLPPDLDASQLEAFIDEIAINAHKNKYLRGFLNRAQDADLSELKGKVALYGSVVFPAAITYGFMLDRLTLAMVDDFRILQVCIGVFRQAAIAVDMETYLHPLEINKLQMVEAPMLAYVYFHSVGAVPGDFAKEELSENIDWAVFLDNVLGYVANAQAGAVLSHYHPDYAGVGGARFSEDGKRILFSMPAPLQWADLYSTWNMAFVSHYESFPFVIPKLLIPSVSDYRKNPDGYMYNRSLALYTHLYFSFITKAEDAQAGNTSSLQWNDVGLSQLWGEVNLESAADYIDKAEQAIKHAD